MHSIYRQRLARLREAMNLREMRGLILTPGAGMRYLTGFSEEGYERLLALVVPPGDEAEPFFVVPSLHAGQIADAWRTILWDDAQGWQAALMQALPPADVSGTWGVDDAMPARFALPLAALYPQARFALASAVLNPLRTIKDAAEMDAMQRAATGTDALLPAVYAACREGTTEAEIGQVVQSATAGGGNEASFAPIVAAGPNSALPHHHTGETKLKQSDVIILDLGVRVEGYCGDITRTVALGKPSDEARRVYDVVYKAYAAGVAAVQPGATGHSIDAVARQVIDDAGYGQYFIHRTGHGIGLDDHEEPYIVAGNHVPLRPGECFSIEPGIYLPGKFGVRLENIVTVREDGTARVLNAALSPEMMVL